MSGRHLHLKDYPLALGVLAAVAHGRDLTAVGYRPTEHGGGPEALDPTAVDLVNAAAWRLLVAADAGRDL
jgi:hypothetical protein